jgi:hypothetical protein
MNKLRIGLVAATVLGGGALASGSAAAMPIHGLDAMSSGAAANVENVGWVCGPYRCWWQPNYHAEAPFYGYAYRPRPFLRHEFREHRFYRDGWRRDRW